MGPCINWVGGNPGGVANSGGRLFLKGVGTWVGTEFCRSRPSGWMGLNTAERMSGTECKGWTSGGNQLITCPWQVHTIHVTITKTVS